MGERIALGHEARKKLPAARTHGRGGGVNEVGLMPARDFQRHMHQHIRVCKRAKYWAERSVAYMKAGEHKRAADASKRCSVWLAKAMEIEKVYRLRNPHA